MHSETYHYFEIKIFLFLRIKMTGLMTQLERIFCCFDWALQGLKNFWKFRNSFFYNLKNTLNFKHWQLSLRICLENRLNKCNFINLYILVNLYSTNCAFICPFNFFVNFEYRESLGCYFVFKSFHGMNSFHFTFSDFANLFTYFWLCFENSYFVFACMPLCAILLRLYNERKR